MSWHSPEELAERALSLLREKEQQKTPQERFAELIQLGLIDQEGRLTKEYGGDAEREGADQAGEGERK